MRPRPLIVSLSLLTLTVLFGGSVLAQGPTTRLGENFPSRPFLLVDAPRRFLPSEPAKVRIQLRRGDRNRSSLGSSSSKASGRPSAGERPTTVSLALYRVHRPERALGLRSDVQGTAVAQTPIGAEAEQLAAQSGVFPRRGRDLTLLRVEEIEMPPPGTVRHVTEESGVYDSNESEESGIATSWMRADSWSTTMEPLGRLTPGLYLARIQRGSWSATALLSVGHLVLLARRGDHADRVLITDGNGRPQSGVLVSAVRDGQLVHRSRTDGNGMARFVASDDSTLRYVAQRGPDFVWSDVSHARLDACDPQLYLATGRPTYRYGEVIYLRGHLRGCDGNGRFVGLANETVRFLSDVAEDQPEEVVTDADGNFTARLDAGGLISAEVRGHEHRRNVRIDDRQLPQRAVQISVDRPWAASGEIVEVRVADDEGGWPRESDVILETPQGRLTARVGPNMPAIFHITIAASTSAAERFPLAASIVDRYTVTMAAREIWVGQSSTLLELETPRQRGRSGEVFPVTVRATSLSGEPATGAVSLVLLAIDEGQRARAELWRQEVQLVASETAGAMRRAQVPLTGTGPWMLRAQRGQVTGELVIWERERPPMLSRRGELAVMPSAAQVSPGERLEVSLRAPSGPGQVWLTLEQGDVWSSRIITPPAGETRTRGARSISYALHVPDEARGLARVVATHIARGQVTTANATVEVATTEEVSLEMETDRRSYAQGERSHVVVEARDSAGRPRDGVISLWLADAGYWDLGEEEYPLPGEYLRLPGRMASAGDSTRPLGFGAEEGRVLPDATLEWNGRQLPRTTYRHGWQFPGELVTSRSSGRLQQVLTHLGRAIGFSRVEVCEDAVRAAGHVSLLARNLPWDLVVRRIEGETRTNARIEGDVLMFECGYGRGAGGLRGRRAGCPSIRTGAAGVRLLREARLEGTLRFIGLRRLGPDGRIALDIDLPDIPGRWRVEVLTIADDGGGARAHQIVHTTTPLRAWLDVPQRLRVGDTVQGVVRVRAPSRAEQMVELEVNLPEGRLELAEPLPQSLRLDAQGEAEVPLSLRAVSPGAVDPVVSAVSGSLRDDVRSRLIVSRSATTQPVRMRAVVGESAWSVDLEVPPLTEETTLQVSFDSELYRSVDDVLETLRAPRWDTPSMRIDRLASLASLRHALEALRPHDANTRITAWQVERAFEGEVAALARHQSHTGGFAWWWRLPDSAHLTAVALHALGDQADEPAWEGAWDALRRHAQQRVDGAPSLRGGLACLVSLLLARREFEGDRALARQLLASGQGTLNEGDLDGLSWALEAARALRDTERARSLAPRLEAAIRSRLSSSGSSQCSGPAWFLCYRRWSDRGILARAALSFLDDGHPLDRSLGRDVARWIAAQPPVEGPWMWGTDEADVIGLLAQVTSHDGRRERPVVRVDGRPVQVRSGRISLPRTARRVTVQLPARAGRLSTLRLDGELAVEPPSQPRGTIPFSRRFSHDAEGWALEIELAPTREREGVEVAIPLPAGLQLARSVSSPAGASLLLVDDQLMLRWSQLPAGRTSLRFELVSVGSGTYRAGSASLRGAAGDVWAITPAEMLQIR